ncbi:hypothetical protein FRX31_003505 [Thalictrum thalictroides]|uniref:Uncharacterized protein n=1 Tax=Thalictrum thalictroides TaxID=46969 RepID=A0A7J6XAY0_THATH|nr:hypothetical protein FRX31_003505 [Thalictrum thalictroides]
MQEHVPTRQHCEAGMETSTPLESREDNNASKEGNQELRDDAIRNVEGEQETPSKKHSFRARRD